MKRFYGGVQNEFRHMHENQGEIGRHEIYMREELSTRNKYSHQQGLANTYNPSYKKMRRP